MANENQLAILKQGVKVWNKWRYEIRNMLVDLGEADLHGADLREADFFVTNFSGANLAAADLSEANFFGADLFGAQLNEANLNRADLTRADLSKANLSGTDLSEVQLKWTILGDIDLSTIKGLHRVQHNGPSYISIDTIYKSKGNIPDVFLRGCGVPEDMIAYAHSLTGKAFDFYSCFISHSAKDKPFCERLHNDLQAKGVRTWYFPEDAKWGETVWGEIDRGIKIYDKLVVVCSKNSLQRDCSKITTDFEPAA